MAILVGKTVLPTRNVPFHGADLIKQPLPQAVAGSAANATSFFDKSSKKRRGLEELSDAVSQRTSESRPSKRRSDSDHDQRKRLKTLSGGDNMHSFKNVRWTAEEIPPKDTSDSSDQGHRLSTTTGADQILVLHARNVAESGTHQELLPMNGRYANMWRKHIRAERSAAETASLMVAEVNALREAQLWNDLAALVARTVPARMLVGMRPTSAAVQP